MIRSDLKSFSVNMAVWWDGDLLRELLDKNRITKYDWEDDVCRPLMIFDGTDSNNGTKSNPCLQGDIIGDWREEVLLRTEDNSALRLYVSRIPTEYRFILSWKIRCIVSVSLLKMWHTTSLPSLVFISDRI